MRTRIFAGTWMLAGTWILAGTGLFGAVAVAQHPATEAPPQPIDFAKVDRSAPKLPPGDAERSYGIYLFGQNGEHRIWAVLEGGDQTQAPSVLYFDLNGDGDLTAANERFTPTAAARQSRTADVEFTIGDYRPPGADVTHREFQIKWTAQSGVRFKLLWRGEKISFGGYGPTHATYARFAATPAAAPIFVPGWDRPFAFERWIETPLPRNGSCDFKVFVGNRGDRVGTFAAVDDEFLPDGEFAVATLHYKRRNGEPATARFELHERC